jgi:hypothetical protein
MGQTTTVSTSRKVQGMDQKTEILFLTLKTTEMKSIRPNDLSLMRNLQRQGLLVEKCIAYDTKELEEIALTFMSSSQTSRFVVFSSDDELYEVARSNLTIEQKKSILPVRKETAFKILGSKVGFIEFCRENSIPHPQTQVIKFKEQLSNLERSLVYPIIIKGDTGAGGEKVFRITDRIELLNYANGDLVLPVIIQENIKSKPYSVEAFFNNGFLCGWMFSEVTESVSEFGGSIARIYYSPEDKSFIEILCKFGKSAQVNGFVNCGFFHSKEGGYLLFEADLRPNAWHYLFDSFDMDMKSAFRNEAIDGSEDPLRPKNLPTKGLAVRLAHRDLANALGRKQYRKYFSLSISMNLTDSYNKVSGTTNRKIHVIDFLKSITLLLVKISYSYCPGRLRELSRKRKFSVRVVRKFLSD